MKKIMLALALLIGTTALECMDAAQEISHPMLQAIDDSELMVSRTGNNTEGFSYCLKHSVARARRAITTTVTSYDFFLTTLDATVPLGGIGTYTLRGTVPMAAMTAQKNPNPNVGPQNPNVGPQNPNVGAPNTLNSLYAFISQVRNNTHASWAQEATIKAWLAAHKEAASSSLSHKQQMDFKQLETEQEEYAVLFFYALQKKFASK
jgi:hypothetical protein